MIPQQEVFSTFVLPATAGQEYLTQAAFHLSNPEVLAGQERIFGQEVWLPYAKQ